MPIYEEMPGWQTSTVGIKSTNDLPIAAKNYIKKIENLCQVKANIISTGPERDQTIIIKDILASS